MAVILDGLEGALEHSGSRGVDCCVGVAVNEAGGGRGVVAVSSLPAGHTMLFPPSLVLTVDKVRLSGVVPPACLQECTEEEVLARSLYIYILYIVPGGYEISKKNRKTPHSQFR